MPVISSTDAPEFAVAGTTFTGLAAPSRGAAETAVWMVSIAPGTSGAAHRLTREEIFVVINGLAIATLAGTQHEIAAGDALVVPPDTDFSLGNPSAEPFRAIVAFPVGGQAVLPGGTPFTPPWAA